MHYKRWRLGRQYVGQFLRTFREFSPRQKTGSFGIEK
jgi:hypothetical protein